MWQYSFLRRLGASGSSSTQQKTKAAGSKPNFVSTTGQPKGNIIQNQKSNKNWYYRGSYSGRTTRGGFRPQVTQAAPPPPRVVPINPGPQRGGGLDHVGAVGGTSGGHAQLGCGPYRRIE